MKFVRREWHTVRNVSVKNCFEKAGFWISRDKYHFLLEDNEVEAEPSNEDFSQTNISRKYV